MNQKAIDIIPSLIIQRTDAQLLEQGYTYNQAGMTYNQAGVSYGGVYQVAQDILPEISLAKDVIPTISGYADIYSPFIPDPYKGMLIAPGLPWQFITYP